MAKMKKKVLTEQETRMETRMRQLFEAAKTVEMTPTLKALAFVQVCLACASSCALSGEVEDDPIVGVDIKGLCDDLDHAIKKVTKEIRMLPKVIQIAIDNEVDATYYNVHENSPTR